MFITKKKIFFSVIIIALLYEISCVLILTNIVDVHFSPRSTGYNYVLVKNFPMTKTGKIMWWKKNKTLLKEKYFLPIKDSEGDFTITIWKFGKGYKEMPETDQGSDLMCFEDMKTTVNCIEKDRVFSIRKNKNESAHYY